MPSLVHNDPQGTRLAPCLEFGGGAEMYPPSVAPSPAQSWGARGRLTMLGALGRAPAQTVLQQLVRAGGAGPCHQAHGGFMQEHLGRGRGHACSSPSRRADVSPGISAATPPWPFAALPLEATSVL